MPPADTTPRLLPHDYLLRATLLRLIPQRIRPNHLTVTRFVLTPVVLAAIGMGAYAWGVPLFLLAALTDALDGSLARVRNQITRWGETFDPLADKLLIGGLFLLLGVRAFPLTTLLMVGIDLSFIIAGWYWARQGWRIKANLWGKLKMLCQVAATLLLLIAVPTGTAGLFAAANVLLLAAIALAVASLITHGI